MRSSTALVSIIVLLAGGAAPARAAEASPPEDAPHGGHRIHVSLLAGFGMNDSNASGGDALNLYGAGFGLRAGYTFPVGLYAGASFVHHLGFSHDDASGRVSPLGAEAGWDFVFGPVTLRPFFGAGVAFYSSSYTGQAGQTYARGSGQKPAFWPGLLATYDFGDRFFAGADARYTIVLTGNDDTIVAAGGGTANALGFYGDVGFHF